MRYIVGIFIALGLSILLIVLLMTGGKKGAPQAQNKQLIDYAQTDAQVSMLINGPINADSQHQQILITVNNQNVTYEHIQGYQGHAVDTRIFANNEAAYDAFLHALQRVGFTMGNNDPALRDSLGYCPAGTGYTFKLTQDGDIIQSYWNTSCNQTKTYLGNTDLTIQLFQAQVPNFGGLTQNISI